MDLMSLLLDGGGKSSVKELAKAVGVDKSQAGSLIGALAPALMRGLQKNTESVDGMVGLQNALAGGNHQRYIDQPELLRADESRVDGNKILGHIFGSKDVSRNVAAQAANETGIDASIIKKALPLIAGLAMGTLSKQSQSRQSPAEESGGLGGLIGGLLGGSKGSALDDVLGLAKRFF